MARLVTVARAILMCLTLQSSCSRLKISSSSKSSRKAGASSKAATRFSKSVAIKRKLTFDTISTSLKSASSKDLRQDIKHNNPLEEPSRSGDVDFATGASLHRNDSVYDTVQWRWDDSSGCVACSGLENPLRWSSSKSIDETVKDLAVHNVKDPSSNWKRPLRIEINRAFGNGITKQRFGDLGEAIDSLQKATVPRCAHQDAQCVCTGKACIGDRYRGRDETRELTYVEMLAKYPHYCRYVMPSTQCSILAMKPDKAFSEHTKKQCFCDQTAFSDFDAIWKRHYQIHEPVGKGGFGIVFHGTDLTDTDVAHLDTDVAVKFTPAEVTSTVAKEVELMRKVAPNRYVPTVRKHITIDGNQFLITDFAPGDQLVRCYGRIWRQGASKAEETAKYIVLQIARAVKGCHLKDVVHRDIKPENIMYHLQSGRATLIDFGLAAEAGPQDKPLRLPYGTEAFMPPEMFEAKPYGREVDIWSLGVTLYELVFQRVPWCEVRIDQVQRADLIWHIRHDEISASYPKSVPGSDEVKNLIEQMLERDQDKRIDIDGVLQHPWFASVLDLVQEA